MTMNQTADKIYENMSNEDLIAIAANCLEEIQHRPSLQDYLSEMTYDSSNDEYMMNYSNETFADVISDFRRYLASKMYNIAENKKETR